MNARQLEVFRTIMREGSLTAAANSLGVSQPAISKVLLHLEDQLGYPLFDRTGGRLVPTAEADLIFDDADRVFRELEVLKDLAKRVGERKLGLLRLGASLPIVQSVLPGALRDFRTTYPEVKIQLQTYPARENAEALRTGAIDIALTLSPIFAPTVRYRTLSTIPIVAVVPTDHPLAAKAAISAKELSGIPLISYGSHASIGADLDEAFRQAGATREVGIQVATSVAAMPLVKAGLGIALIDGLTPSEDGTVALEFSPEVTMPLIASRDSARPVPRLVEPFLNCLKANLFAA